MNFGCPHKLKPYYELSCPQIGTIRAEVLDWMAKNTDLLTDRECPRFDRWVDWKDLAKKCPSIIDFAKEWKVPFRDLQFGIIPPFRKIPLSLHAGEQPQSIKINIPICNTEYSVTQWFGIPKETLDSLPTFKRDFYEEVEGELVDLRHLEDSVEELYPKIGEYHMLNNPVIFNAYIPHRVRYTEPDLVTFPRVLLSIIPISESSLLPYLVP